MFSEELNKLIEASLVDGVLTDKERAVIRKRALLEGVDPDEVDLMLDAEVQKIRKKQEEAVAKVKKCPSCGEIIPALTGVCPSCGYVINIKSKDNNELMDLLDSMEKELESLKSGRSEDPQAQLAAIDSYRRKAKTLYGDNKKVQYLLAEIDAELDRYKEEDKKKGKNKLIKRIVVIAIVLLCLYGIRYCSVTGPVNEAKKLHTELCSKIDELGIPSEEKYEEQKIKLLNIVWTGESGYGFLQKMGINREVLDLKNAFIAKKRAYATQLNSLHKKVYGNDDDTKEIQFPDAYIDE